MTHAAELWAYLCALTATVSSFDYGLASY